MSNFTFMGPEYGKAGNTWASGSEERYEREHGLDPATGGVTGPLGPVPAGLGLKWQAAHDQAVWNARFRMGLDALRFAQGATGLLTSFRRGGGSALEAGVYSNLAQVQLQRAAMHQPLDLLGDYRRDVLARAGRAGRTESTVGMVLQGVGAVASIFAPYIGLPLMAAGSAVSQRGAQKQQGSIAAAQAAAGGGGYAPQTQQGGGSMQTIAQLAGAMQGLAGTGGSGGGAPSGGTALDFYQSNAQSGWTPASQGGGGALPQTLQQGPGEMPSGDRPEGGPQAQGGPAGGGMPPVVGADGVFLPNAYARNAVATSPVPDVMQVALSERMAEQISQDPTFALLSMAIDRELALRTTRAA